MALLILSVLCIALVSFSSLFNGHLYLPAQLVRGFALRYLLDMPWSQVPSILPARDNLYVPSFSIAHTKGSAFPLFSFFMLVDFHRILVIHALPLSASQFVTQEKRKWFRSHIIGFSW